MAGETWVTPKNDLGVEAVPTTLLNNIGTDLIVLHRGGGYITPVTIEPDVLGLLDVGETNNTFLVVGDNDLYYITTTNRQFGNTIHLIKTGGTGAFYYGGDSAPTGSLPIYYNGITTGDFAWYVGRMVTLTLGIAGWHHDAHGIA